MKTYIVLALLLLSGFCMTSKAGILSIYFIDSLPVDEIIVQNESWTMFGDEGSIKFSEETIRLLTDADYRANTYPESYQLSTVPDLFNERKIMLALWTLINVYPAYPQHVQAIVLKLSRRGIRGQHYLSAFYTYAFADPEVFHFGVNEASYLENPLRMEEKLETCKTLATISEEFLAVTAGK